MTRVLVTGATGRVGSELVAELADGSTTVRIASRAPDDARERFGDGHEYVAFDVTHPETWGAALDGVDGVFLVFPPSVGVDPIRSFVGAASRVGVDHLTYLSILGAEKLPVLPHRRIERRIEGADPTHTLLRSAYFMQNLSGIHRPEIASRDEVFVPAGDGRLGFVDARDVSAVAALTFVEDGHENRAYDLTGARAMDFYEVARTFSDVLGRRITYANPSRRAFARRMYERGVEPGLIAFMLAEYQVTRWGLSARTTDEVARLLGRDPTPMRRFVKAYRERFDPV